MRLALSLGCVRRCVLRTAFHVSKLLLSCPVTKIFCDCVVLSPSVAIGHIAYVSKKLVPMSRHFFDRQAMSLFTSNVASLSGR